MPAGGRSVRSSPLGARSASRARARDRALERDYPPASAGDRRRRLGGREPHAEPIEQLLVVRRSRVRRRQQPVAEEHRVGAGQEAERLRFVGQRQPAGAQPDERRAASGCARWRSCARARADPPAARSASGVPSTRTSRLTGTLSGCGSSDGELLQQPIADPPVLAHADDAAAADRDARLAARAPASRAARRRSAW